MPYHFSQVSLLITHYNRSSSLANLLKNFQELNCSFAAIIVSDDGSLPKHFQVVKKLQDEFGFQLITVPKNRGLGNNINKGQDAVKSIYTLYVQEDFEPTAQFPSKFAEALTIFEEQQELDMIRFYAYNKYPYLKPYKNGFSEMLIKPWYTNYQKIYYYSDHPHLRRSTFFEKFGRYAEGLKTDRTEYRMCVSFIKNKGKALFYNEYKSLFNQINTVAEPSTVKRSNLTQSGNFIIKIVRDVYRQVKYNFDLLF